MARGSAFARIAPFAAFIALLAVEPWLGRLFDPRWLVVFRGVVAAALLAVFWRHYEELRPRLKPAPGEWLLAIAAGLAVFGVWIGFDSGWAAFGGGGGFAPVRRDGALDLPLAALRIFTFVLVVPVMEELFWRSFFMRWIDRRDFLRMDPRNVSLAALAVASVLFAAEHSLWFAGLVAGAVYGYSYRRAGDLRLSIVSHATTNGTLGLWILATGSWRLW